MFPAFHHRPNEAVIIGRLLVNFGELEYKMVTLAGRANGDLYTILKALYRLRATAARIEAADAFARPAYSAVGINGEYGTMLGALRYCLSIRNQFSHCNGLTIIKKVYFSLTWRRPQTVRPNLCFIGITLMFRFLRAMKHIFYMHRIGYIL
jgi:hypothetical protein